jgi:flagellar hook-associated protein 2
LANIQFGGLVTGLDTNALITGLAKAEHRTADILQNQKVVLQAQQGVYATLTGALASLKSTAGSLSVSTDFSKRTAASSDATVLTASVDSSAQLGSSTILVDTLAKARSVRSTSFTDSNAAIGTGTLTIAVGTTNTSVVIDATNNTLTGLKSAINSSGAAVTASIVNVGTSGSPDYRLMVQSKNTGTANAATVSGTLSGGADPFAGGGEVVQAAADAVFSVNGLSVTRDSNTISDVLPGVTFVLRKEGNHNGIVESTDASANVTVSIDSSSIKSAIKQVVDSYNAVNKIVTAQFALNPDTKRQGVLAGDAGLRGVMSRLRTELSAPGGIGAGIQYLSDIGITFQKDGSLTLDDSKLTSALESDATGVSRLFTAVQNGIGKRVPDLVDNFINSVSGSLVSRQKGIQTSIDGIDRKVTSEETRIAALQDRLTKQFTSLEKLVSQLKSQGDFLTQNLTSLSLFKK